MTARGAEATQAAEDRRTLGVSPDSWCAEIRAAYLRAAQCCHPDKNPGNKVAEETFRRVEEAYQTLVRDDHGVDASQYRSCSPREPRHQAHECCRDSEGTNSNSQFTPF